MYSDVISLGIQNHPHDYSKLHVGDTICVSGSGRWMKKLYKVTAKNDRYFDCKSPFNTHYSFTSGAFKCGEIMLVPDPDGSKFNGKDNRRRWRTVSDEYLGGVSFE